MKAKIKKMAKKDTLPEKKKKRSEEKTPKVVSGQKVQEGKVLPPEKAPSAYHLPLITRVMEIGLILVIVGTPLLFSIWSKNNFLLPKETYAESILIILLGIYLIKVVEEKKFNLVKSDIWYPLFAFLAITLISMVNTISLYLSLLDLAEFLSYFFVLFLTVNFIRTKVQRNRLFWALVAVCIISSTYAVCQFYNLEFKFWARQGGRGNIFSTFGNPNRYSGFVSACILPMIAYFLISKGWRKYLLGFAIPLTYTGVMMTFTRGAQMGLAVALLSMLIIVLLFFGRSFFKKFFYKIVYLVLVFGVITLIFSTENPINYTNLTLTKRV
ncbi:hypothetical protein H5U35_05820, partial [Candidatus Aerophobetes bacterium]|nr:hypothetical protein [Candidatus Aerophobetes bacterium]